ncbi:DNA polymerase epsilon subunit 2 [Homalodisca vitripennis]|nr:DNA polymerase epsilon subunit 2 [Homalodisca vitripennis]
MCWLGFNGTSDYRDSNYRDSTVVEKLKVLFAGYDDFPPTAMVLMGNFLSSKQGSQLASVLKAKMKLLADLLALYPNLLANTKFVIVPGPGDCLTANILPR